MTKLYGTLPPKGYTYATGKHGGIDLVGVEDKTIYAIAGGSVIRANFDPTGWGNYVVIRQEDGYYCIYAHLAKISVKLREKVDAGQEIGIEGATGNVTGSHLHLELRKEYGDRYSTMNPATYLQIENCIGEVKQMQEDTKVSDWAKEAKNWVVKHGISDGTNPKETCTREEVWTMLFNLAQYWSK